MLTHVCVGTNDLPRAQIFYDAIFAVLGARPPFADTPNNRLIYKHEGVLFLVGLPIDGEPATHANGGTVGLKMESPEQVDAWYAAGIAHGGTAIEDPPGLRQPATLYLAYLRDPDGNKLCASYRMPKG